MWQHQQRRPHQILASGLRHGLMHVTISLLAVGIAFSLPSIAQYVLFEWWPKTQADNHSLMVTEIGLSALLVLLFNALQILWQIRHVLAAAKNASLVYATESTSKSARKKAKRLAESSSSPRDLSILTLTGFNTFVEPDSLFHKVLNAAYEIRVMLLDPRSEATSRLVDAIPDQHVNLQSMREEIAETIAHLTALHDAGKRVTLKFCEHAPLWKVVVAGDNVWVQHCHHGFEVKQQPEYVFALKRGAPRQGFFVPFYLYFLEHWNRQNHPVYDFDSKELVYRACTGQQARRIPLRIPDNAESFLEQSHLSKRISA